MSVIYEPLTRNVCRILINRQHRRNALDLETITSLKETLRRFEDDDQFRIAILGGVKGNFCAGYDLAELLDAQTGMPNLTQIEKMLWPVGSRLTRRKITIAAIEGHAAGFGFELALKCDFRVADNNARMGFLNRRFGVPIMNGGTVTLPKIVGYSRALDMIATGKAQLAQEALQHGTIHHISDVGCAFGKALNVARNVAKNDEAAQMLDLELVFNARESQELELMRAERGRALDFLRGCGPRKVGLKFLKGELCRHGNTDLGNLAVPVPEVTL